MRSEFEVIKNIVSEVPNCELHTGENVIIFEIKLENESNVVYVNIKYFKDKTYTFELWELNSGKFVGSKTVHSINSLVVVYENYILYVKGNDNQLLTLDYYMNEITY